MSRYKQEDGAVAVIVTISLVVLMSVAALAVDAGRGYVERSNAQNAADHAALSAAWAECTGKTTDQARAAGLKAAARNGYDTTTANVTKIGEGWRATIDSEVRTTFGRVLRPNDLAVGVQAVGGCEPGTVAGNRFAMYAGGSVCAGDKTIEWSGNETVIEGDVHSNGEIHISGNDNHVEGKGTFVTAYQSPGSGNTWAPPPPNPTSAAPTTEWPVSYNINDYRPGGKYHLDPAVTYFNFGSDKIEGDKLCGQGYCEAPNRLKPGIYHTTGEIIMKQLGMRGNVTLVSSGNKHIELSGQELTPYSDDLLAFSNWHAGGNSGCSNEGIRVHSTNRTLYGTLFAPGSVIQWDGDRSVLEGSMVALKVKINGPRHRIVAGEGGVASDPHVYLLR